MNYYIDVKYTKRSNWALPYFKRETSYQVEAIFITCERKGGVYSATIDRKRYGGKPKEMADAVVRDILMRNCDNEPVMLFGVDTAIKAAIFYDLLPDIPYWMSKNIMDIQLYADMYILPNVNFEKLAEQDKIDFIQTRPLSLPEKKDVIRLHTDYPIKGTKSNSEWAYYLHKFYTELEKGL